MLDGVGEETEKALWRKGILSWDDFFSAQYLPVSLEKKKSLHEESLVFFSHELALNNVMPFAEFIKRKDHWRLFQHFKELSICIDIETNGMPADSGGDITVIGIFDGNNFRQYVKGINLTEEAVLHELSSCKMIISFYGSVFDIPFIMKSYRTPKIQVPHFDLCFASRQIGLSGGLKKIEKTFGFQRDRKIDNLNGFDAVKLWYQWEKGDQKSLDALLRYNRADTVNLYFLAEIVNQELYKKSGFHRYYDR